MHMSQIFYFNLKNVDQVTVVTQTCTLVEFVKTQQSRETWE